MSEAFEMIIEDGIELPSPRGRGKPAKESIYKFDALALDQSFFIKGATSAGMYKELARAHRKFTQTTDGRAVRVRMFEKRATVEKDKITGEMVPGVRIWRTL